jgi:hypothetical protein
MKQNSRIIQNSYKLSGTLFFKQNKLFETENQ